MLQEARKNFKAIHLSFSYLVPVILGTLFGMCSFIGQHEGKIDTRNILLYANILFYILLFTLFFFTIIKMNAPPMEYT